jgi:hypothetical protein
MTTQDRFRALVRPGARIRFRGDSGTPHSAKVSSCNWKRGYVRVHLLWARNPQKVPAWAIEDVLPDWTDLDAVETWLARGPLGNPYQRPSTGPMTSFYIDPTTGKCRMGGNTDRGGVRGLRPTQVVLDEATGPGWFNQAETRGMHLRSGRGIQRRRA